MHRYVIVSFYSRPSARPSPSSGERGIAACRILCCRCYRSGMELLTQCPPQAVPNLLIASLTWPSLSRLCNSSSLCLAETDDSARYFLHLDCPSSAKIERSWMRALRMTREAGTMNSASMMREMLSIVRCDQLIRRRPRSHPSRNSPVGHLPVCPRLRHDIKLRLKVISRPQLRQILLL